jgi:hypothetical protein
VKYHIWGADFCGAETDTKESRSEVPGNLKCDAGEGRRDLLKKIRSVT